MKKLLVVLILVGMSNAAWGMKHTSKKVYRSMKSQAFKLGHNGKGASTQSFKPFSQRSNFSSLPDRSFSGMPNSSSLDESPSTIAMDSKPNVINNGSFGALKLKQIERESNYNAPVQKNYSWWAAALAALGFGSLLEKEKKEKIEHQLSEYLDTVYHHSWQNGKIRYKNKLSPDDEEEKDLFIKKTKVNVMSCLAGNKKACMAFIDDLFNNMHYRSYLYDYKMNIEGNSGIKIPTPDDQAGWANFDVRFVQGVSLKHFIFMRDYSLQVKLP